MNTMTLQPRYGFKITTSSPHCPRGHGFTNRQVQTIQNVFNRCAEDGTDANLALLQLRATPLYSRTPSPGELLQNRQLKTTLLTIIRFALNSEAIRASLQSRQDYSRYDAHAKELPQLLPTQPVRLQDPQTKNVLSQERSYQELRPPFIFGENTYGCPKMEQNTD